MNDSTRHLMDPLVASVRALAPTADEVRRVMALDRARRSSARRRKSSAVAVAITLIAVAGGTYAVPTTRAAVDDVYSTIASWVEGDGTAAPGRPPAADEEIPGWLPDRPGDTRVIAERAGVKLVAFRESADRMSIALGDSVGLTESIEHWRQRLAGSPLSVLGPASFPGGKPLDEHGRLPLLGLVAQSVSRVELRYRSGKATSQDGLSGGFVLLVKADEPLQELVGYDSAGRQIARLNMTQLDLAICRDPRGCPPGVVSEGPGP